MVFFSTSVCARNLPSAPYINIRYGHDKSSEHKIQPTNVGQKNMATKIFSRKNINKMLRVPNGGKISLKFCLLTTPSRDLNSLNQACRISRHNAVVLHVARYHRACSHDSILADGYARQNRRSCADPAVAFQMYGLAR